MDFTNCNIWGNGWVDDVDIFDRMSGTGDIGYQYCNITANALDPNDNDFGASGVTDGGNNIYTHPQVTSHRRKALVVIQIDDKANSGHFEDVADYAATKGLVVDIALDTGGFASWTLLDAYAGNGHGVSVQTRRHCNLTESQAMTITYGGDGTWDNITIVLGTDTFTTTVSAESGSDDLSYDLSTYANQLISNLCTDIHAEANWSCDYSSSTKNHLK